MPLCVISTALFGASTIVHAANPIPTRITNKVIRTYKLLSVMRIGLALRTLNTTVILKWNIIVKKLFKYQWSNQQQN